jgi:NhaA family Na+:H+ antiporter
VTHTPSASKRSLRRERIGGLILFGAAVLALVLANSPLAPIYLALESLKSLEIPALLLFFFSVGIELRHEIRHGSLRNPRTAIVPIFAAVGGMLLPVVIYSLVNAGLPTASGWGIPMSTDIAFALAALALAGRGLVPATRTFVMTVAVTDDTLTILIIAVFFTSSFSPLSTISLVGVLLGLFVPGASKTLGWLTPTVAYVALPIFAFFACGAAISGIAPSALLASPVVIGILLGQLVGKPLGVVGTAWLVTKSRLGKLATGLSWADLRAVAWLFGMCFTIAMLMSDLGFAIPSGTASFSEGQVDVRTASVVAVLASTTLAGLLATIFMRRRARAISLTHGGAK